MTLDLLLLIESLTHRPANAEERSIASAIVSVVDPVRPVFGDADTDAAVMLETAWRESYFLPGKVGDRGKSFGYWQLQRVDPSIMGDVHEQAAVAYERIRYSVKRCGTGANAMAAYVSNSCTNRGGQRLSAFRMAEARRMVGAVHTVEVVAEE